MPPWRDDEWEVIMKCQDQEGHGYAAHAVTFSNHGYRYVPTLCDACRKIIDDMERKRNDDRGTQLGTERSSGSIDSSS